jgi:hypothetical protein
MPAWIPWSIIFVFVLILIIPLFMRTKKTDSARHRKYSKRQLTLQTPTVTSPLECR